jgi:hypothetical protein
MGFAPRAKSQMGISLSARQEFLNDLHSRRFGWFRHPAQERA